MQIYKDGESAYKVFNIVYIERYNSFGVAHTDQNKPTLSNPESSFSLQLNCSWLNSFYFSTRLDSTQTSDNNPYAPDSQQNMRYVYNFINSLYRFAKDIEISKIDAFLIRVETQIAM